MNFIHRFLKSSFLFNEILIDVLWILTCEFIRMKTTESRWMNDQEIKFFLDQKSW